MENYDRQQDGGNFGEAKEDVLPIRSTARQFRRTPGTATGGGLLKLLAGETLVKGARKCPRY